MKFYRVRGVDLQGEGNEDAIACVGSRREAFRVAAAMKSDEWDEIEIEFLQCDAPTKRLLLAAMSDRVEQYGVNQRWICEHRVIASWELGEDEDGERKAYRRSDR